MAAIKKIALVPLDDRPCNLKFPAKLASGANVEVLVPPKEYLGYFTSPGLPMRIIEWMEKIASEADAFIISLDMLAYGGLIASRSGNTSFENAENFLNIVPKIKHKYPNLPIYLFSVIMRISTTVDSADSKKLWGKIFRYSELEGKRKMGGGLSDEREDEEFKKIRNEIPKAVLEDYLNVRERNHRINNKALDLIKDGAADFLALSKEDCSEFGPHKSEEAALKSIIGEAGIQDKAKIINGADEVAAILTSKAILGSTGQAPGIAVRYSKNKGDAIALYEDTELNQVISDHIDVAGGCRVEALKDADIVLFVHSFAGKQNDLMFENIVERNRDEIHLLRNFCSEITMMREINKKAAVADVCYANGADLEFVSILKSMADITHLAGYAGWNTASNSIGCAVAGLLLPYSKQFLIERLIDDVGYQSVVRPKINKMLEEQKISPFNLGEAHKDIETRVVSELNRWAEDFFSGILGPYKLNISLPWPRTFEIDCDIIFS